ncbi:MAG: transporter substrate-binding domain-containing protein [Marinobacter sp.]|nr:transporter substrate-binding domain-containing protein [Marinobacter sp.]
MTSQTAATRFIGLVLFIVLFSPASHADDTITWGWEDWPPSTIRDGEFRNQGYADRIRDLLIERMPAHRHEVVEANFTRIMFEIESGNLWCYIGARKTAEREQFAVFSLPVVIRLPHRLFIREEKRSLFGSTEAVSFASVIDNPDLRTSVMRGRSYTPVLDQSLQQAPHVQQHTSETNAIRMLLFERIDYLIEYPQVMAHFISELEQDAIPARRGTRLIGLAIEELPDISYSRVICPNTEAGVRVIRAIDDVLREQRPTSRYREIIESWHDDESVLAIRRIYDSVFLTLE